MITKNMTKEQAIQELENLKKRVEFNNKLNAFVRKFRKEHSVKSPYEKGQPVDGGFNGYWDAPTPEMAQAMKDILLNNALGDTSWMSAQLKRRYAQDTSVIFGQLYSCAVNRYILNDIKDCEKFIATFDNAVEKGNEENDLFRVERDTNSNRINLYFDSIPDVEVRNVIKHNGFRWSPNYGCWTRQLTDEAEKSLARIKRDLNLN